MSQVPQKQETTVAKKSFADEELFVGSSNEGNIDVDFIDELNDDDEESPSEKPTAETPG
jgi:hypothetical protein